MIGPEKRLMRSFDWLWFLAVITLAGAGVMTIWSTTSGTGLHSYFARQLIFAGGGLVLFFILLCYDYHLFSDFIAMIYVGMMAVLGATILIGRAVGANKSWLDIG